MNSFVTECTEVKRAYDACYSVWFTDKFLKGDTNDTLCADLFQSYHQCLKTLKEDYDKCFNYWFAEKFLKGDNNDSLCSELLKNYTNCVQKAMKEHNIQLKELDAETFEVEKNKKT